MKKLKIMWYQTLDGLPRTEEITIKDSKIPLKIKVPFDIIRNYNRK